jgi:hypothetical protein
MAAASEAEGVTAEAGGVAAAGVASVLGAALSSVAENAGWAQTEAAMRASANAVVGRVLKSITKFLGAGRKSGFLNSAHG